ncbi:type II secretion system protein GspM [Candidatus Nitrotoga sp. AM1P]|uniref:type II secretion system protein GspM n=1 Tax=Candidatus Nitrotoga sp. AM1P TaxID=2559597 RepID=UPI0010B3DBBB|nr:type II secretion system protein GspM [Candidatus Nitrotoga sp. AM1P]BBJ23817.1 type II secretion system protein M [Candidatus Nitrotoga sp. AM1P]
MRALSKNQSRGLAIGLLILFLTIGVLLLFIPINMLHRHYDQSLDSLADYLGRYRHVVATHAEVQSALDQVKQKNGRQHFLRNTGVALAASEIQETAKNLIEANGGKLVSMQVVPFKDDGGYRRVTVNIQFTSNLPTLRKILYAVETVQPYLLLDNVSIRSQANALNKGAPVTEPELIAQFDASGYTLVADKK